MKISAQKEMAQTETGQADIALHLFARKVVFSLHIITQFQSSPAPFFRPHSFGQQMDQFRAAAACSFSDAIYRAQMLKIGMAVSCHDNLMYCF